ncbi:phage integrase N-terminal SAM-like domain-containing protein [Sporosarcina newyorkensis]|uniref:phage integrase N-terminal SAM-like domain-containing protein n=2 Tax=Sporosarcina newyorkensis TaxID=759851 RepID=UPI000999728C
MLRGLSQETLRGYKIDSCQFLKWLLPREVSIGEITGELIEEFMRYLIFERGCQPTTINRKLNTLDRLFYCLKRKGFIMKNPLEEVDRLKTIEKERNYLTRQELNSLLAAIDHEILYPFIFTMIHTGMRVSECRNLKLVDVYLNE